jgi:hypothetical protein
MFEKGSNITIGVGDSPQYHDANKLGSREAQKGPQILKAKLSRLKVKLKKEGLLALNTPQHVNYNHYHNNAQLPRIL